MQEIPAQLASALPPGSLRLQTRVCGIRRHGDRVVGVVLEDGEEVSTSGVVVATDVQQATALTGSTRGSQPRAVACLYFAAARPPIEEPILVLDGEGRGPVTNLCVPSRVADGYAPAGQHLVAATVVGAPALSDAALEREVRAQMSDWFGAAQVEGWRHLRTYRIPWAQFDQPPGALEPAERPVRRGPGLYVCGDHVENASINGALHAGRRAAEAILEDLRQQDPVGTS
jgi:phytoene dehydrogenase-like protein